MKKNKKKIDKLNIILYLIGGLIIAFIFAAIYYNFNFFDGEKEPETPLEQIAYDFNQQENIINMNEYGGGVIAT